jgi:diguanylate cyclase (GGDEF)-like protein
MYKQLDGQETMTASGSDKPAILVVDDDDAFRQLMCNILQPRGYTIFEARTPREADQLLTQMEPLLTIVDYRLPETDGLTWITNLREAGRKFPIVFVTATWVDAKTFNWLRNILKVSLILSKPIVPELFLQQIEPILPARVVQELHAESAQQTEALTNLAVQMVEQLLSTKEFSTEQGVEQLERLINSSISQTELVEALRRLDMKVKVERQLTAAKGTYVKQVINELRELGQLLHSVQRDPGNRADLDEAIQRCHKIAGSAGTFGMVHIGEVAKKIENLMRSYDPTDTLQEVLWNETFRGLGEAEQLATAAVAECSDENEFNQAVSQILMVGSEHRYREYIADLNTENHVNIVLVDNIAAALIRSKKIKFDAALIDLALDQAEFMFKLTQDLREVPGNAAMPIGFISDPESPLSPFEILFYGASAVLELPFNKEQVHEMLAKLHQIGQSRKPRVLVVDDDEVLSGFVATILRGEQMVADTLNSPIQILEKLNDFQPDVVVLDVIMPGLSGYDVCRVIRRSEEFRALPVVFLTSKSNTEGRAAAFAAGGNDFLSKPVLAPELIMRVRGQIDRANLTADADKDKETGVLSRKNFFKFVDDRMEEVCAKSERLALCLLSIDDFVALNAAHSPSSVEHVITALGGLLQTHFRTEDLRGRLSEEVFALSFRGKGRETVAVAVELLLQRFHEMKFSSISYGSFKCTVSAGVAIYPDDGSTTSDLLTAANQRLTTGRLQQFGQVNA